MTTSRNHRICLLTAALCIGFVCSLITHARASSISTAGIGFCKPYTWLFGGWVAPPRVPLCADVNGDGYIDFLYASPAEKLIDVSLNGRGLKPLRGQRFLPDLPRPILSMCTGPLCGKTAPVFVMETDGALTRILTDEGGDYTRTSLGSVAGVNGKHWLLAGRLDSKDTVTLALVSPGGFVRLVDPQTGKLARQLQLRGGIIAAAAGDTDGDGEDELALQTKQDVMLYRLGKTEQKPISLRCPKGQPALAMGDVNADGKADVLVNGCVFLGPSLKQRVSIDGWGSFSKSLQAFLADVNGDGRADVVIQHEGLDYYASVEADCNIYLTYRRSDPDWDDDGLSNLEEEKLGADPLNRDTDCDGLLDGWEVHGFGDSDLPGMGASPLHKDVCVMNLPASASQVEQIRQYMTDVIAPFFARLPFKNLDGTYGFAIHFAIMTPVPAARAAGKGWEQLADEIFPKDRIGIWHWMQIPGMSGGGQSGLLADVGVTGLDSWAHEIGHQLGLTHSGKWDVSSPTYASLMNYAYSAQFDGKSTGALFSTGESAALILNEQHLPEKVPCSYGKLKCLSNKPYEFRVKALGPDDTWVDWNWNGVLDNNPVKADITWGEGMDTGQGFNPGGCAANVGEVFDDYTDFAPELVVHCGQLYYLVVKRTPTGSDNSSPASGPLMMSCYQGNHSFGAVTEIDPAVTNDPSAVSDGKIFYVFYPTFQGIVYRFGQPGKLSKPCHIPQSTNLQVRAFVWSGTVYVLLYSEADRSIHYCSIEQDIVGPVHDLGIKSTIPPSAAVDTIRHQLLLGVAQIQGDLDYRWQLCRLSWDDKAGVFKQVSCEWLGGDDSAWYGNGRLAMIFDASPDAGPQGRVFFFGRGFSEQARALANVFAAHSVAYKDYNGGWLLKRIGDFSYQSRQTVGVALFNGDIVLARTWGSNTPLADGGVYLCYDGTGISDKDMADCDDISLMANYGIARSIGSFVQMPTTKQSE